MNLWGFTPSLFDRLERLFRQFLAAEGSHRDGRVLPSRGRGGPGPRKIGAGEGADDRAAEWVGATYAEDKPVVMERLRGLIAAGVYPRRCGRPGNRERKKSFTPLREILLPMTLPPKSSASAAYGQNC